MSVCDVFLDFRTAGDEFKISLQANVFFLSPSVLGY